MFRWTRGLAPLAIAASLAGVAACGGSASAPSKAAPAHASAPANGYQPFKLAQCGTTPPSGSYDFQFRNQPGMPIRHFTIRHTKVDCGQPFTEVVDFTHLGDNFLCEASPLAPDNRRRPCDEAFKQGPDFRTATLNLGKGDWRPTEGRDRLPVVCQAIGNRNLSQGTLRDDESPPAYSNVWNLVRDPRIVGGAGFINDIWMGNAGFRGRLCHS